MKQKSLEEHRRDLGPVEEHHVSARAMPEAHRLLGEKLREPARKAIRARLADTGAEKLARELDYSRGCRKVMEARPALAEFLECLEAWSEGVGLAAIAPSSPVAVTSSELALWAQDDNTGCVTGMLRLGDGAVLLWHDEEDTIGYMDRPRLVSFDVAGWRASAFLYPYLLPGPAFGWGPNQLHALDSLFTKRSAPGTLTGAASWLLWKAGADLDAAEALDELAPFADGCAVNLVRWDGAAVTAEVHEFGGPRRTRRALAKRRGSLTLQANAFHRPSPAEALTKKERGLYERRVERGRLAIEAMEKPSGETILGLLSGRRGGAYAFANTDVYAHVVARVAPAGLEVHVGSGAALAGDLYAPSHRHP